MTNNVNWIKIHVILDRLLRHPLLTDLNLETVIQYTLDFLGITGFPAVFVDKTATVTIKEYRGTLPCDLVAVNQVRLHKNGIALRGMTDSFNAYPVGQECNREPYNRSDLSFKTQGRVIFTSLKDTTVDINYKAIMLDEEGLPMLPDNDIFLKTLELYIKKEAFTILFDMGKINPAVLQNVQQEYAFRAGQCNSEFTIPSVSEMEAISGMLNQFIPRMNEFKRGFRYLGSKEHLRLH